MKIILPIWGDDIADHLRNIYHRVLKNNESVITTFNGVGVVFFSDEINFEHPEGSPDPRFRYNHDAVKAHYLHDLEKADPSGYSEIVKIEKSYRQKDIDNKEKLKQINDLVNDWQYTDSPQQKKKMIKKILES
jgi:hypothetical protein